MSAQLTHRSTSPSTMKHSLRGLSASASGTAAMSQCPLAPVPRMDVGTSSQAKKTSPRDIADSVPSDTEVAALAIDTTGGHLPPTRQ